MNFESGTVKKKIFVLSKIIFVFSALSTEIPKNKLNVCYQIERVVIRTKSSEMLIK